MEKRNMNL